LALYVGGLFEVAGEVTANNLGKWDRVQQRWEALESGIALADYDHGVFTLTGGAELLYVGGRFRAAGDKPSAGFAVWGAPVIAPERDRQAVELAPVEPGILVEDDFSTAEKWDFTELPDGAKAKVTRGVLQIDLAKNKNLLLTAPGEPLLDVAAEIEIQYTKGATGDYMGLGCRTQANSDGYWFLVSRNGYYRIEKQLDGDIEPLVDWATSKAIDTEEGAVNKVHIRCAGSELTLLINEIEVAKANDASWQEAGFIQLFAAGTPKASRGTRIVFDNLVVAAWDPS
jgi:hypothetical protein